jgi:hypothetical protein
MAGGRSPAPAPAEAPHAYRDVNTKGSRVYVPVQYIGLTSATYADCYQTLPTNSASEGVEFWQPLLTSKQYTSASRSSRGV